MTSTIKVDNIQDQDGNNIINENSNTITIGASGDTVTLASGATQSGFGRSGTVDWDTTAKTASFTAESGRGYFVDTTLGLKTVTLPASPSAGDIVSVKDYTGTFSTNNCIVSRNGSNLRGGTINFTFEKNNSGGTFIYVDATEGWQVFLDGSNADAQPSRIIATGGTITTCGLYKIHTFTGPGTFCVSCAGCTGSDKVDYMVIAGGGGGGGSQRAGGGGAGGFREVRCTSTSGCWTASPLAGGNSVTVTQQGYPISVGGGGAAGGNTGGVARASSGTPSTGLGITATGGGGGGGGFPGCASPNRAGLSGGSGGGGGSGSSDTRSGGNGNNPPVSPPQGKDGGTGNGGNNQSGGGGGGATVAGTASPTGPDSAAPGGTGATNSITGASVGRAGGGGGGKGTPESSATPQGTQGGGDAGAAGVANKGGGGGGASSSGCAGTGGAGGSGIVVIRYRFQ
jgi:hypothetical protein